MVRNISALILIQILLHRPLTAIQTIFNYSKSKVIVADRLFVPCNGVNTSVHGKVVNLAAVGQSVHFDLDINVMERVPSDSVLEVPIERCASKESPDTCLRIAHLRTSQYCSMIADKGEFWSSAVECIKPKIECPVKKGIYRGVNCSVDWTKFSMFPLPIAYWKFTITVKHKKAPHNMILCGISSGDVRNRRNL